MNDCTNFCTSVSKLLIRLTPSLPVTKYHISSVQFSSVTQSCPTLCDPMNHSTPGLPVHHQLPEFTQTCNFNRVFYPPSDF